MREKGNNLIIKRRLFIMKIGQLLPWLGSTLLPDTFHACMPKITIIPNLSLIGLQNFFLFWLAGMILEVWYVKLERVHSFGNKALCHETYLYRN